MSLKDFRKRARLVAILRDGGSCMVCKWVYRLDTRATEVHHVFGRGTDISSVEEDVTSLMCVCMSCHPQPILLPPSKPWQKEVLAVWRNMNCSPHGQKIFYPDRVIQNPVGLPTFKIEDGIQTNWSK